MNVLGEQLDESPLDWTQVWVTFDGQTQFIAPQEVADADTRKRIAAEGVFHDGEGNPLTGVALRAMRIWFASDDQLRWATERALEDSDPDAPDWLIPGLWRWGTIPMLGGKPKAGKTTLACELIASLVTPGRQFLGHFEAANLGAPLDCRIWYINAETPAFSLEEALASSGAFNRGTRRLVVEHLEAIGGPALFDLTAPDCFEMWERHFIDCLECDGSDFWSPDVVIVDGLTAILGGSTDRYGEWYAAFRRLMRSLDVPNALVIAHTTLAGTHLMGGVEAQAGPDGLWTYTVSQKGRRSLSVIPRLGGASIPPTPVELGGDGRLQIVPKVTTSQSISGGKAGAPSERASALGAQIISYVNGLNILGAGPSARELRANVPGTNTAVDSAVRELIQDGQLVARKRSGQGGGLAYFLSGHAAAPPADGG